MTKEELTALLAKMEIQSSELIRKGEAIWKENYKGKTMSEEEYIDAMVAHPKLIQRPIVEMEDKALVCRPPELVLDYLK